MRNWHKIRDYEFTLPVMARWSPAASARDMVVVLVGRREFEAARSTGKSEGFLWSEWAAKEAGTALVRGTERLAHTGRGWILAACHTSTSRKQISKTRFVKNFLSKPQYSWMRNHVMEPKVPLVLQWTDILHNFYHNPIIAYIFCESLVTESDTGSGPNITPYTLFYLWRPHTKYSQKSE